MRMRARGGMGSEQDLESASASIAAVTKGGSMIQTLQFTAIALTVFIFAVMFWVPSLGASVGGLSLGMSGTALYSVVIDAGSTGSRVHVYTFEGSGAVSFPRVTNELFEQLKPGLSAYATEPQKGAESLRPLMDKALATVPKAHHASTRVFVGATAGLRMLPGSQSQDLLSSVHKFISSTYPFALKREDVQIMTGTDEGKYAWVATNMLLGKLSTKESVGVIDLGGGSMQMMRSLDRVDIKHPNPSEYLSMVEAGGAFKTKLYVHSFLNYGLMAARKLVLEQEGAAAHCMLEGYTGKYEYGGKEMDATGGKSGFQSCLGHAMAALDLDKECGSVSGCAFSGKWVGRGVGHDHFYMLSYIYERIEQVKAGRFGAAEESEGTSSLQDVKDAARRVCGMTIQQLKTDTSLHPQDPPFICLDLTYIYAFLNVGLGISGDISLAKKFMIGGKEFEAAWALGAAVERLGA